MKALLSFFSVVGLLFSAAHMQAAIDPYEFSSELDRARYQQLVEELRCPKCQNQNLAGSNSPISLDLRTKVAEMIHQGLSDAEIKEYMVNRYGDFVLYRPPVQNNTLALWLAPLLMAVLGLAVFLAILLRRRKFAADNPAENAAQGPTEQQELSESAVQDIQQQKIEQ